MNIKPDREIERRFLYERPILPSSPEAIRIAQGYVAIDGFNTVRVRTSDTQGIKTASVCIKGPKAGAEAPEFEWDCALSRAAELFELCAGRVVNKVRHPITYEGCTFEVDVFEGPLAPLVIVELELATPNQRVKLPGWVGEEITDLGEYSNAALATRGLPPHFHRWAEARNIRG